MAQHVEPHPKWLTALASAGIAVACLAILIMMLAGPPYFMSVVAEAWLHIAIVALLAGLARVMFRSGSILASVVCGALMATAGFYAILFWTVSRI